MPVDAYPPLRPIVRKTRPSPWAVGFFFAARELALVAADTFPASARGDISKLS